jgi:hypothetical protein
MMSRGYYEKIKIFLFYNLLIINNKKMKKKIAIVAVCSFAVFVLAGCGKNNPRKNDQENSSGAGQFQQRDIPAGISSACQGKNEGDSCEMNMPQKDSGANSNKVSGTCRKAPSGDQLSCMPQSGQGGPGGSAGQAPERRN